MGDSFSIDLRQKLSTLIPYMFSIPIQKKFDKTTKPIV